MAKAPKQLTGDSSIATWLKHPVGGPMLRELLVQGGQKPDALNLVRVLPLKRLVAMSKGEFTQEMVDELVSRVQAKE
jgi:hypothetical protein